jgi:hypothetical protein
MTPNGNSLKQRWVARFLNARDWHYATHAVGTSIHAYESFAWVAEYQAELINWRSAIEPLMARWSNFSEKEIASTYRKGNLSIDEEDESNASDDLQFNIKMRVVSVLGRFLTGDASKVEEFFCRLRAIYDGLLNELQLFEDEEHSDLIEKGRPWQVWIGEMSEVLKDAGFSVTARRDIDSWKRDTPSPFVRFVGQLQELIPNRYRGTRVRPKSDFPHRTLSAAVARALKCHRAKKKLRIK